MKTVYKYKIEKGLTLPRGAEVLKVGIQNNDFCLWALVDTESDTCIRHFEIYGTGHPVEGANELNHLGTIFEGAFVWHVFERWK